MELGIILFLRQPFLVIVHNLCNTVCIPSIVQFLRFGNYWNFWVMNGELCDFSWSLSEQKPKWSQYHGIGIVQLWVYFVILSLSFNHYVGVFPTWPFGIDCIFMMNTVPYDAILVNILVFFEVYEFSCYHSVGMQLQRCGPTFLGACVLLMKWNLE